MRTLGELRDLLKTVVMVTVTPFTDTGDLDADAYQSVIARSVAAGITVVTPNGNTGEFYSLTSAEQARAVELTAQAAPEALIVAGVAYDCSTAIQQAETARDQGAECIMIHQPVHPFRSAAGWVDYHRQISQAVAPMGVVLYVRDPHVDAAMIAVLVGECPNVIGVKYAVADPPGLAAMVRTVTTQPPTWLCGLAEGWAPFFAVAGAEGFTSGLACVDPARSLRLHEHLMAGEQRAAMDEWYALKGFEDLRARNNSELNVSVVKQALAQLGLCAPHVRAPIGPVPDTDRAAVTEILGQWHLVEPSPHR